VLTSAGYERLLREVGALVEAGRTEAETKAGHVLAVTYWKVGERLLREGLTPNAGYGDAVVERLADELGMARATLQRARRFASLYDAAPEPGLSWTHYKELLTVADGDARAFYARRALAERWSGRLLRAAIGQRSYERGSVDVDGGAGLPRPEDGDYLYRCRVVRVIDADTLLAHVDLGFEVIKEQRVRLSLVDAPEAKTRAGRRAADWVRERLATAGQVVVKTVKAGDAHGRYVAHVFYGGDDNASAQEVFRRGRYLNGELVARGLAKAL
jgi:endonuclease YncB( thermonuclease family)